MAGVNSNEQYEPQTPTKIPAIKPSIIIRASHSRFCSWYTPSCWRLT